MTRRMFSPRHYFFVFDKKIFPILLIQIRPRQSAILRQYL